jgi:Ca2+-binding RTX toxin-like protein
MAEAHLLEMSGTIGTVDQNYGVSLFRSWSQFKAQKPAETKPAQTTETKPDAERVEEASPYVLDTTNTPAEANAYAVALGVETLPGQVELLSNRVDLGINPSANAAASSQDIGSTVFASAETIGQGLGQSRYVRDEGSPFYKQGVSADTLNLVITSEGEINGSGNSEAFATGFGTTAARARSLNVALANLDLLGRYQGVMRIGGASPFTATALASGLDLSGPTNTPLDLEATAISRGFEGGQETNSQLIGQTETKVAAKAWLSQLNPEAYSIGSAYANSVALEKLNVTTTSFGNGDGTASVMGIATAETGLQGPTPDSVEDLSFEASAIGLDESSVLGHGAVNNVIKGVGSVAFQGGEALQSNSMIRPSAELTGIGARNAKIITGNGNDTVIGIGQLIGDASVDFSGSNIDLAGFRNSKIYTGDGDDQVSGVVVVPDNLDGLSAEVAFKGFDHSTVNTGLGNDLIEGNAYMSDLYGGIGGDILNLDNAWSTRLMGGLDNDVIRTFGKSYETVLDGGLGNDELEGGDGDDLVVGGLGIDAAIGGGGTDTFVYSGAGALGGTASSTVNSILLGADWNNLALDQQVGVLRQTDRVLDFASGPEGDRLQLSSALGSITNNDWMEKGQVVSAEAAQAQRYTRKPTVVVDTLANIQSMGIGSPRYAVASDRGLLLYDADGNYASGTQVVAALGGDLSSMDKENFRFA